MLKFQYLGEIRSVNSESRHIEGRALSFNVESRVLCEGGRYFTETLSPGCITEDVLNRSNVILNYNHDRSEVLARSRKRKGSLSLELKEDGLYFATELPNTRFADEMLELIKRGDISECSFCFTANEDTIEWDRNEETGIMHRTVNEITDLYDVSVVVDPAYGLNDATFVAARSAELVAAEQLLETRADSEKDEKTEENEEKTEEKDENSEEKQEENETQLEASEDEERAVSEDDKEDNEEDKDDTEDSEAADTDETKEDPNKELINNEEDSEEESKQKRNQITIKMNKNYILGEIRSAMESPEHKFTMPAENRTMTVTGTDDYGVGDKTVETEIQGVLEPLYADSIISNLGVRMYSGLPMGNVRIPVMGKGAAGWESEISEADATGNTFTTVTLSPKRISAVLTYSKLFLAQDTIGVEAAIRRDMYNALASKIQQTFLGSAAGDTTKPAGIFNGITANDITSYEDLCNNEALVDDSNVAGEKKYVMSNKAKAVLRNMAKSSLTSELVLDGNDIDGTQVIANSDVPTDYYAFGNFGDIAFGSWGDVEVIVDPYTKAAENCVRIVINSFCDWAKLRPSENTIVYGEVKKGE